MISNNLVRLEKQRDFWEKTPPENIRGRPKNGNLFQWEFYLKGPIGTPYAHFYLPIEITLPQNYPASAPSSAIFTKGLYHPNVSTSGSICIDVIKSKWVAGNTLVIMLNAINALLSTPGLDNPFNSTASKQFPNKKQYLFTARTDTMSKKYALKPPEWWK